MGEGRDRLGEWTWFVTLSTVTVGRKFVRGLFFCKRDCEIDAVSCTESFAKPRPSRISTQCPPGTSLVMNILASHRDSCFGRRSCERHDRLSMFGGADVPGTQEASCCVTACLVPDRKTTTNKTLCLALPYLERGSQHNLRYHSCCLLLKPETPCIFSLLPCQSYPAVLFFLARIPSFRQQLDHPRILCSRRQSLRAQLHQSTCNDTSQAIQGLFSTLDYYRPPPADCVDEQTTTAPIHPALVALPLPQSHAPSKQQQQCSPFSPPPCSSQQRQHQPTPSQSATSAASASAASPTGPANAGTASCR